MIMRRPMRENGNRPSLSINLTVLFETPSIIAASAGEKFCWMTDKIKPPSMASGRQKPKGHPDA